MVRAYDALADADSTISAISRFLPDARSRMMNKNVALYVAPFERRLAELLEAKGDSARAAGHYRRFIDLWKKADPEFQPRVAEARARLAKLTPVEKPR